MSAEFVDTSSFVEPYFIEELDDYGLTATDIAKSLGTEAKKVRQKLLSRDFMPRIEGQGFRVTIVTLNNINGVAYEEPMLDTAAAKFFVAKYDSPAGDAYLAFLIRLESRVKEMEAMIKGDSLLREIAAIHKMRVNQLQQEKRLTEQEQKTLLLEARSDALEEIISDAVLDSILITTQKKTLKNLIDSKAMAYGSPRIIGQIQRGLKERFGLNTTNDRWYHLPQRSYQDAVDFVGAWGSGVR